jgi:hypothetical protein
LFKSIDSKKIGIRCSILIWIGVLI